jgi:cold shock CspA family protein
VEKISPRVSGILKKWNNERGFGFISRIDDQDVFLHITDLQRNIERPPQVGDTVSFVVSSDKQGRNRARNAKILGVQVKVDQAKKRALNTRNVHSRKMQKNQISSQHLTLNVVVGLLTGTILTGSLLVKALAPKLPTSSTSLTSSLFSLATACSVKGNISQSSGRKLYHVPGMEDYENTSISLEHGERWFCSENEAKAAGWVRAPR